MPSRNGLGIIGPISKDQFTPESIKKKIAASPFAKETNGKVRLMVMTNSTYDGLCYNIDAIKETLGDAVEVLHFDEAWYAYANFHEFYDGYHGISSASPARSPNAITFATHSTHKLLAALSQASMIHIQHGENRRLDMTRFNDAFMMHTSTSPQYGIIASCDVAAAMMEQPAGRALVQETIEEALSFRRAMTAVRKQLEGSWWFDVWQPDAIAERPSETKSDWVLKPGDRWHGFEGLAENHVLVDPIKVTILSPGPVGQRRHAGARHSRCRGREVPVVAPHRDREDRPLLLPRAVLDGHHQGQVEHAGHRAAQLQGSVRRQRAAEAACCRPSPTRIRTPTRQWASRTCATGSTRSTARTICRRRSGRCTPTLPEMAMRPADAYERLVHGRVESVEIDDLMGRTLAVMIVPYPPGIPLIMPGERITEATKSIHDYLLYARDFDQKFPGLRDRHPRPALRADRGRKTLPGRLRGERSRR